MKSLVIRSCNASNGGGRIISCRSELRFGVITLCRTVGLPTRSLECVRCARVGAWKLQIVVAVPDAHCCASRRRTAVKPSAVCDAAAGPTAKENKKRWCSKCAKRYPEVCRITCDARSNTGSLLDCHNHEANFKPAQHIGKKYCPQVCCCCRGCGDSGSQVKNTKGAKSTRGPLRGLPVGALPLHVWEPGQRVHMWWRALRVLDSCRMS